MAKCDGAKKNCVTYEALHLPFFVLNSVDLVNIRTSCVILCMSASGWPGEEALHYLLQTRHHSPGFEDLFRASHHPAHRNEYHLGQKK